MARGSVSEGFCNLLIAKILFANDFYNAWKFAPFLMISVVFGGMCGLLDIKH